MELNGLKLFIGRNRWLKRPLLRLNLVPALGYVDISKNFRLFVDVTDLYGPSYHVMFGGPAGYREYERPEKDEIEKALPEDGVLLDIGANVGLFSFYFAQERPRARIFAFEPHPLIFTCLNQTQTVNEVKNVAVEHIALGEKPGQAELFISQTNAGGHTLLKDVILDNSTPTTSVSVPVRPLDTWVEKNGLDRVDVIKMDVQGFERHVLLGGSKTLAKFRPTVVMECDNKHMGDPDYLHDIFKRVPGHPYQFHVAGKSGPYSLDRLGEIGEQELSRGLIQSNYVFQG